MSEFVHFSDIRPDEPATWAGRKILSVDVDWASDDVLSDTLDFIEDAGVKACVFVTHDTPVLARIRACSLFELGLHPNFDGLLQGRGAFRSAADVIQQVRAVAPEAVVLRSHAMTTSGRWLPLYEEAGVTHLSNYVMFGVDSIRPFRHINGLVEVPVYFADDGYLYQEHRGDVTFDVAADLVTPGAGVKVYNFHPIHVFLNSENLTRYARSRTVAQDTAALLAIRHDGEGSRTWLRRLLSQTSG